eukprot:CAMPEP_0168520310 /NCGR_PEP_ID=MMETSP0405-20121227/7887_1 /TAXON_ID=498012 /ORGANISM="Trichosphaerium sp, Strain Am-I-7 wt" /LENGTH=175 /DNA_ID=CAMNT_0008541119 /DNA_START=15 /DNA_END=539 /DNA_ORIENTATION=-
MASTLQTLHESYSKELGRQTQLINTQKKELDDAKEQLEEEKRIMAGKTTNEDIIDLNVGGTHVSTTRRTLCLVEGSMLQIMFSGRWENKHTLDKEGRIFLDMDPSHFAMILGTLRAGSLRGELDFRKLKKAQKKDDEFAALVEYLGILPPIVEVVDVVDVVEVVEEEEEKPSSTW